MAIVDTDTKSLIINQLTTDQLKELQETGNVEDGQVYVTVDPLYHDLSNIDAMTADRALITDGNGKIDESATTSTELGYVHGVTSAIQTQLDAKASNDDLALKAPLASPELTGTPTAPTASSGTDTTQIATTAFVQTEISTKAPLDSPVLTGTPTAPTAEDSTNNTQIATTAFVKTAVSNATPGVDNLTVETFDNSSAQGGSTHDLRVKDEGITIDKMNSSAFTLKSSESKNSATIPSYAKVEEMVANATPVVDNSTISYNSSAELQAIGTINKNDGGTLYNWRGTLAEYEAAVDAGTIQDNWICVITDDFNPGVTFSGEIVSVTKTFTTASNHVEFTEKCRSKNYLTVFQDRVFIYPSEYTLDNDFMGITFTNDIEQGSTVTVNYFKGVPSEKVDELIEAAKDVGIKKYESTSSYSTNELVVNVDDNNEVKIYQSLADDNTSSLSDTTKWKEVELGGAIDIDNNTISLNSNEEIQTIGVIDSNNNTTALKLWTGTRAEYDAITTKDENTLYNITDDTGSDSVLANTNLSNLTATGESHFANPALTNSPYTTNRILEIPQDIKLELVDGTLTLKAGSKVYVPNGFEEDGTTPKFDVVVIESDKTCLGYAAGTCIVCINDTGDLYASVAINTYTGSGSSAPTDFIGVFYNTTTNMIGARFDTSSQFSSGYSLPIAIVTNSSTTVCSSIDQVFNGFGYIGSTVFVLPGVKVQGAFGVNDGGTYKLKTFTTDRVLTSSFNSDASGNFGIGFDVVEDGTITYFGGYANAVKIGEKQPSGANFSWWNPIKGESLYVNTSGIAENTPYTSPRLGLVNVSGGRIGSIVQNTIDSLVTSNASNFSQAGRSYLSGLGMPSDRYIDLTLGASGSTYTAPANGWFFVIQGNNGKGYLNLYDVGTTGFGQMLYIESGFAGKVVLPVKKGDVVTYGYVGRNANDTVNTFRFIYAEGETDV